VLRTVVGRDRWVEVPRAADADCGRGPRTMVVDQSVHRSHLRRRQRRHLLTRAPATRPRSPLSDKSALTASCNRPKRCAVRLDVAFPLGYSCAGTVLDFVSSAHRIHEGRSGACAGVGPGKPRRGGRIATTWRCACPTGSPVHPGRLAFVTVGAIVLNSCAIADVDRRILLFSSPGLV